MSEITILKAHLVTMKGGHGLNVTYLEKVGDKMPKKIILENPWFVHDDLLTAMNNLNHHYAIRTFYVEAADVADPKKPDRSQFRAFHVHGISLSEDKKKHYVIISGHVEQEGSSPVNVHTPIIWLKEDGENVYVHVKDLLNRLERLKKEIEAYIREEKMGKDPQLSLDLKEEKVVTSAQIAVPLNDGSGQTTAIPPADPEAQKRIKEDDGKGKKVTGKKKVQQTASHPSGEAEVAEEGG